MGFWKETAELSAVLNAANKKGLSGSQYKAVLAAYNENVGKDPVAAALEMLNKQEPVAQQAKTLPIMQNGASDEHVGQPDAQTNDKPVSNTKDAVIGSLILIAFVGTVTTCASRLFREEPPSEASATTSNSPTADARLPTVKDTATAAGAMQSPEEQLVERIQTYWLPELNLWSARLSNNTASFADAMTQIDLFNSYLADLPGMSFDAEQEKVIRSYKDALGAKQARILPEMRKQYARQMDELLFRQDIRVTVHGSGSRTLRLTGAIFIRNANIADTQSTFVEPAHKLRFSRIEYRWSPRVSETTYYDLDTPADNKVE